jgi:hypothetical protein
MYYNQDRRDKKMKTKTRTAHTLIPKEKLAYYLSAREI